MAVSSSAVVKNSIIKLNPIITLSREGRVGIIAKTDLKTYCNIL